MDEFPSQRTPSQGVPFLQGLWRIQPERLSNPDAHNASLSPDETSNPNKHDGIAESSTLRESIDLTDSAVIDLSPPTFWSTVFDDCKKSQDPGSEFVVGVIGSLVRDRVNNASCALYHPPRHSSLILVTI
jgi:hypothetical protein